MKSFISSLFGLTLLILTLLILEGACFRLVENYAKSRLELAWGKPGQGKFHSVLKKIPLDHFISPPSPLLPPSDRIRLEDRYATSLMSFGRATRDRLQEELETSVDPLAAFEIKDIGVAKHVIFPGLQTTATLHEVKKKMARRVGDPMEYAKGMLLRVVTSKEKHIIEEEFTRLEIVFKFVLDKGLACAVISASSPQELMSISRNLTRENPMIARDLYVWGDDEAADIILEVTQADPGLFQALMVHNPEAIPAPRVKGMPWILLGVPSTNEYTDEKLLGFLSWLDRGRDADKLYPSRLGGLLKISEKENRSDFESFAIPYLFESLEYFDHSQSPRIAPVQLIEGLAETESKLVKKSFGQKADRDFDLFTLEEKMQEMEESDEISLVKFATFDCEIIRGYRQIHADDRNLQKVSNRDLVLKLGLGFEQMGEEVLEKIGKKDPLFLRFYNSLSEVQESPFN